MKLFEIIQPNIRDVKIKQQPHHAKERIRVRHGEKVLGQGRHGHVYDTNPHTVTRIGTPYDERDDHTRYIKTIAKNERMASNPYFPRVYKHKTYRSPRQELLTSMEVEKLTRWDEISTEELLYVGELAYGPYFLQRLNQETVAPVIDQARRKREKINNRAAENKNKQEPYTIVNLLTDMLSDSLNNSTSSVNIIDPQLKQALMLIKSIKRGNSGGDIYRDNIMFRRTPHGVHLVFTDPL